MDAQRAAEKIADQAIAIDDYRVSEIIAEVAEANGIDDIDWEQMVHNDMVFEIEYAAEDGVRLVLEDHLSAV